MKKYVLLLGLALTLEGIEPSYAQQVAFKGWVATCGQFAQRMRGDFVAYRANRTSRNVQGSRTAVAYLTVGITILPRSSRVTKARSGSSQLQIFRHKQMQTIAQMRRAGCYR